jgi:ZIP family zinc transporter
LAGTEPILQVFFWSLAAAFAAGLGGLPQAVVGRLPQRLLGWGNALAAGLMLGVAYALLDRGLGDALLMGGLGALVGMISVEATHRLTGTEELDLNRLGELDPAYGYQVVVVTALHSAYEGVAIGTAMLLSVPFGISMTAVLAVHNVPEAMLLTAVLRARRVAVSHAATLAVAAKLSQVLLAVAVFALGASRVEALPLLVGFSAGALLQLLLEELLPEAYRQAGSTGIALVTLVAMGMVVALGGLA